MNKIVHKHIPAGRLPRELTADLPPDAMVTVTLEPESGGSSERPTWHDLKQLLDAYRKEHGIQNVTTDEAVARVRALRDEWGR